MKPRIAENCKIRRPVKRTKSPENMNGNSLVYLKFIMVWAVFVLLDFFLLFKFEYLWPIAATFRSVYDSYKYQGVVVSIMFVSVTIATDLMCYFFMPISWMYISATSYVWLQCIWYTVAGRGVCVPSLLLCSVIVYAENGFRAERAGESPSFELSQPFAVHSVGYPAASLVFCMSHAYVTEQPGIKWFNFSRLCNVGMYCFEQSQEQKLIREERAQATSNGDEHKHLNGSTVRNKKRSDANGSLNLQNNDFNSNKVEKPEKSSPEAHNKHATTNGTAMPNTFTNDVFFDGNVGKPNHNVFSTNNNVVIKVNASTMTSPFYTGCNGIMTLTNGKENDVRHDNHKGSAKSTSHNRKEPPPLTKEEKRRNRIKDKLEKERELADSIKYNELKDHTLNNNKDGAHKDREREKERELEERANKQCMDELFRVKSELEEARTREADAKRELQAVVERSALIRTGHSASAVAECARVGCAAKAAALEAEAGAARKDAARARDRAARHLRDRDTLALQLRSLEASRQETQNTSSNEQLASHCATLQERTSQLERTLSAENRVKLDLLSALGEAKRQCTIREGLISRQEKTIEELKAQLLAVMPSQYSNNRSIPVSISTSINQSQSNTQSVQSSNQSLQSNTQPLQSSNQSLQSNNQSVQSVNNSRRGSPLDPNASIYTPILKSDA